MNEYIENINAILRPNVSESALVLDLFAGCGGLSLGFEAAGFKTVGFEMDVDACNTYNKNLLGPCHAVKLNINSVYPPADIVIGGPPCQPFSVFGHQKGINDSRDGFPAFIAAIKKLHPSIFLFENVRGLLFANKWYFELILTELRDLGYIVEYQLLNAVNYRVPQNRERLFVVGHRGVFNFPVAQKKQITVGQAIGDTMYNTPPNSKFLTPSMDEYVARYEKASSCVTPRDLHFDKPARTLTCRNLAGATSDMHRVKLKDGRRRRLLHSEAARLQSFPDWFEFTGNETKRFNQIGNAVPPLLAYQIALAVKECYKNGTMFATEDIINNKEQYNKTPTLFEYEKLHQ